MARRNIAEGRWAWQNQRQWAVACLFLGATLALGGCDAVAKLIIARPVSGTLVVNGAPVAGTQLVRRWHWHLTDERGEETTTTGADGRFTFDAVERRKPIWGYFPHEPVIQMEFLAMRGDGLAPLVICSRRRYDLSREDRCAEKDNAPYQIRFDQSGNGQS